MGSRARMETLTLNEILLDSYRRLKYRDSPAAGVVSRFTTFANTRHRRLLSMPGLIGLRDDTITFPTVASQQIYSLPPSIARIKNIFDPSTNQRTLTERSLSWLRNVDPHASQTTGVPEAWIPFSARAVQNQPAAATAIYLQSTSAGDVATVYVEYIRTGGYQASKTVAMTGVNGVQVGTDSDIIAVTKLELASVAVGTVTLQTTAIGGTVLASIAPGSAQGSYLGILLWPTPASVVTMSVDCTRKIPDLVQTYDEPLLPLDFHYLIGTGIRIEEYETMDDDRRNAAGAEWDAGVKKLLDWVENSPSYIVVPGGAPTGWSSLGPNYPAGS